MSLNNDSNQTQSNITTGATGSNDYIEANHNDNENLDGSINRVRHERFNSTGEPSLTLRDSSSGARAVKNSTYSKMSTTEKEKFRREVIDKLSSHGQKALDDISQYGLGGNFVKGVSSKKMSEDILGCLSVIELVVKGNKKIVKSDNKKKDVFKGSPAEDIIDEIVRVKSSGVVNYAKVLPVGMAPLAYMFNSISFSSVYIMELDFLANLDKLRSIMVQYSYNNGSKISPTDTDVVRSFLRFYETFVVVGRDNIVYRLFRVAYFFMVLGSKVNTSLIFRFMLGQYNLCYGDGNLMLQDIVRNDPVYLNSPDVKGMNKRKAAYLRNNSHLIGTSSNMNMPEGYSLDDNNIEQTNRRPNVNNGDVNSNVDRADNGYANVPVNNTDNSNTTTGHFANTNTSNNNYEVNESANTVPSNEGASNSNDILYSNNIPNSFGNNGIFDDVPTDSPSNMNSSNDNNSNSSTIGSLSNSNSFNLDDGGNNDYYEDLLNEYKRMKQDLSTNIRFATTPEQIREHNASVADLLIKGSRLQSLALENETMFRFDKKGILEELNIETSNRRPVDTREGISLESSNLF